MKLLEYRVTYPSALVELCLPPYPGTLFFSAQSSSPSSFRLPVCWGAKRKKSLLPSICVYQVCAPLLVTCKRLIHPGAPRDNLSVPQVKQNWLPIWPWLKHLLQSDIIPVPAYFVASCRENTLLRCPATISCAQRLVKTSEVIEEIQIEDLGTIVEDMSAHGVYNQQKNKNNTSKLLGNEWKEVILGMSAELNKAILVAPHTASSQETVVNILIHLKDKSLTPRGVNSRQCFSSNFRPCALTNGHHPSITSPWLKKTLATLQSTLGFHSWTCRVVTPWQTDHTNFKQESGICNCIFFQTCGIFFLQKFRIVSIFTRRTLNIYDIAGTAIIFMGRRPSTTFPPKVLTLSLPKIHSPQKWRWVQFAQMIAGLSYVFSQLVNVHSMVFLHHLVLKEAFTSNSATEEFKVTVVASCVAPFFGAGHGYNFRQSTAAWLSLPQCGTSQRITKAPIASAPIFGARHHHWSFRNCRGAALGFNLTACSCTGCYGCIQSELLPGWKK